MMEIYEKLKDIRNSKNISTYELANITGISQSTISKIENGKRKLDADMLVRLSIALDIPVDSILGNDLEYIDDLDIKRSINEYVRNLYFEPQKPIVEKVFIVDKLLELGLSLDKALSYVQFTRKEYEYLTRDRLKILTTILHIVEENEDK